MKAESGHDLSYVTQQVHASPGDSPVLLLPFVHTAWEQLLKLENNEREQRRQGMTFSLLDFLPVLTFLFALKNAFDPNHFRIALKF